jgi:hypothetical protein
MQEFTLTQEASAGSLPAGLHPDDLHIITIALSAQRPAAPAARTAAAPAAPAQPQPAAPIKYGPAVKYAGDPGVVSWFSERQYNEIVSGAYADASQLLLVHASAATGSASFNSEACFFLDPDTLSIVSHKPNKRPPITRMVQLQVALQNVRAIMASHLEGLALKVFEPPTFPPPRPQPCVNYAQPRTDPQPSGPDRVRNALSKSPRTAGFCSTSATTPARPTQK